MNSERYLNWIKGNFLKGVIPDLPETGQREKFRACAGALLGIFITALISTVLGGKAQNELWLIAPMGASAIILFTLPASPLAQPWAIIGGNLVSAFVGVTCLHFIQPTLVCVCVAVFIALALMFLLRCLHPPSGAVALLTILGGDSIKEMGYQFILSPLLINTLVLVLCAVVYNKTTGQEYPHRKFKTKSVEDPDTDSPLASSLGITKADISKALNQNKQLIDVDLGDLENIFLRTERLALNRRVGNIECQQVMTTQMDTFEFATELNEAWEIIKQRNMQALPVLTRGGHLIGVVTRSDFLNHIETGGYTPFTQRLKRFLKRTVTSTSDKPEVVGQIMRSIDTRQGSHDSASISNMDNISSNSKKIKTVLATSPMLEVVPLMIEHKMRHVAVVNQMGQFVGMINQTDMIAALYQLALANQKIN